MLADVYNQKGEKTGQARLPKEIFGVEMNQDFLHQVVLGQMANRRRILAKTKNRAEVRGGGKKPWRQKGTGRARHGSIRSPIWKGGGVAFGPTTQKTYKTQIPKTMRRKALCMVLSAKAKNGLVLMADELKVDKAKTKLMVDVLNKLFLKKGSGMVIISKKDEKLIKSINNIPKVRTVLAKDINALDLLSFKYVLTTKEAIKVMEETFLR